MSDFGVNDDSTQAWLFTRVLKLYGKVGLIFNDTHSTEEIMY